MIQEHIRISSTNNQKLDALILRDPRFPEKRPAILVIHGWTSNKKRYIERVTPLVKIGYVCLVFDMRGHGESDGELKYFSRKDHLDDCLAAYDALSKLNYVDPDDIAVFGSSYGGHLASMIPQKRLVKHLVLKAPAQYKDELFNQPTMSQRGAELGQIRRTLLKPEENMALSALSKYRGDLLLLECEKDEQVPKPTIEGYINAISCDYEHHILVGSDHSSSTPEAHKAFIKALYDWFLALKNERIVDELREKYPGKVIVELPSLFPKEFICEVEPTSDHPGYSVAIAVIERSIPHLHRKTAETYKVLKGELTVHLDGKQTTLQKGEAIKIKPNTIHWAEGHETWVECRSEPGWTVEDHVRI